MKKIILFLALLTSMTFYAQWWIPQNSGVTQNLNDVYGITGNMVVVVGNAGTILKTTDGGEHWIQKTSGTTVNLMKVQFVNATIGYAVGESGTLLKSTDGGENWSSITTGFSTNLYGLTCLNENVFYISGDNGLIKKTSDGGATFSNKNYPGSYVMKTVQFLNDHVGYACSYEYYGSDNNAFIKTTNGGDTWALLSNEVSTFFFLNETIGFIKSGPIFKTIDGGLNSVYMGESNSQTVDLFSLNENVVWSVENNFTLCNCSYFCIEKRDITNTELPQQAQNCYADTAGNPPFEAITFADATNGYVVGDYGIIYKNTSGNMEDLAVVEFDKKNTVIIYPNPTADLITIENKNKTPINSIIISDLNGRTVFETKTVNSTLDVSSLSKGIYLVQLASDEGITTEKLIKK